jgi:hypothetical protein
MKTHQVMKAAGLYFVLVFGSGFVLGTIRVLLLDPAVGTRTAELLEMPVMFGVIVLAARWVTRRIEVPPIASRRLVMGGMALAMVLALDFTVILWIRGLSFKQYVEAFDPVAGTAYFVMLGVFALMPIVVSQTQS